jgi:hypothetical protein
MLYQVVVALSIISTAAQRPADPTDMHLDPAFPQFMKFMTDFRNGVPYSSAAETLGRFTAFKANLQLIGERNAKGQETHGITKFADLTREEFKAQYLTLRPPTAHALRSMKQLDQLVQANYTAASTDWSSRIEKTMCAIALCTDRSSSLRPRVNAAIKQSRSVIMPTTRPLSSTTGAAPQSCSQKIFAAITSESVRLHERGLRVITSETIFAMLNEGAPSPLPRRPCCQ